MTFDDLFQKIQAIPSVEKRACQENYVEIVLTRAGVDTLTPSLLAYFGLPLKPPGQPPCHESLNYSTPYGGIQSNQTMFARKNETGAELVLLWPWGNGENITVKIIRQ
ncbi:MAG: hypothetical protein HQL23_02375 [Candidatus Omnitrophica bacterium]|nr:hypothetical protein [Candidatus Omnitrophota bacterium]